MENTLIMSLLHDLYNQNRKLKELMKEINKDMLVIIQLHNEIVDLHNELLKKIG